MYELIQTGERSYYVNSPVKVGVYRACDGGVYLIDTGNDKESGRKLYKILNENKLELKGIVNTHSNADHIGGNRYLQQQTGCKIFANKIEAAFTKYPILEPSFLYGGCPCKDLRHKFLLAQESDVSEITDADFPSELEVIELPGHFFDMIGIRTPDGTVFLADCLSSQAALEKYQISFIYDVAEYLKTLDKVEAMEAGMFVPAHADASSDLKPLINVNRNKVFEIADRLVSICETPVCFEDILKKVFDDYALTMNFEQYILVGSTVKSYLTWLKETNRITALFEDNRLLWKAEGA